MEGLTRRDAISTLGALAAVASCTGLGGCQTKQEEEKPPLITGGTVSLGPASTFPAGTAHTQFLATYGIVVVNDSGTPVAIRPKCTHMGCIAKWTDTSHQFECPCHGSKFNLIGQPTHGPATRPLPAVACTRDASGNVSVNLTRLYAI